MWGNGNKAQTHKVDTLIGENTVIQGDLVFKGGLHVDGKINGNVIADGESSTVLVLSNKGAIEGEVRVPYQVINGSITGDLHSLVCVELASNARVKGNVYYNKIEMAMGAEVNGNLVHLDEAEKPLLTHNNAEQSAEH
ncbi:MAG: polymer-forming cytoskeletal protein [Gammaproteobacteria bacterium]